MKKIFKTIYLTILTAMIVAGNLLTVDSALAQDANDLVVVFEQTPLFGNEEDNFMPGQNVTRWVKVTNNSGEDQEIGVNITNHSDCSGICLSDELNLIISEKDNPNNPLYIGSLNSFYKAGEIYLSNLPDKDTNQYDFSVTFTPEAGNDYQGLETNFDFEIGFWGESISSEMPPGGSGGVSIAGLIIFNEEVFEIGTNNATIIWDTNEKATSRVIYSSSDEIEFDWKKPPNYGYSNSTPEYNNNPKVISHSVLISGLTSGATYHYRCVSHASPPTISREYTFTTLEKGTELKGAEEEIESVSGSYQSIPNNNSSNVSYPRRVVQKATDFTNDAIEYFSIKDNEDKGKVKGEKDEKIKGKNTREKLTEKEVFEEKSSFKIWLWLILFLLFLIIVEIVYYHRKKIH